MITGLDPSSRVLSESYEEICERFVPLPYEVLNAGKPEALARVAGRPGHARVAPSRIALPALRAPSAAGRPERQGTTESAVAPALSQAAQEES